MTDDAEKAARIAARDMAWEIKGDMGLPEEDYDELIEAFLQGQRHERERWRPLVLALIQRLIMDGDHSELVGDLYELVENTPKEGQE